MNEIILKAESQARELLEDYARESDEQAYIELGKGMDGAAIVNLVIENAPQISASLAMLIGTLQRRGLRFKLTRDGLELGIDGPGGAG